jgi:hypothetical protein
MPRESFSTITTTTPKTRYRTGQADRQRSTKSRRFAATETIKVVAAQQSAAISNTMREGRLDEDDVKHRRTGTPRNMLSRIAFRMNGG